MGCVPTAPCAHPWAASVPSGDPGGAPGSPWIPAQHSCLINALYYLPGMITSPQTGLRTGTRSQRSHSSPKTTPERSPGCPRRFWGSQAFSLHHSPSSSHYCHPLLPQEHHPRAVSLGLGHLLSLHIPTWPTSLPITKGGTVPGNAEVHLHPVSHPGDIPMPAHPQGQPCPSKAKGQLLHTLFLPKASKFQLIPHQNHSQGWHLWGKIPRKTPN